MLNWTPKPTRTIFQTLTDRAGGVGQYNIPLFPIKLTFSKLCPSQKIVDHASFAAPPPTVVKLVCAAFVSDPMGGAARLSLPAVNRADSVE